MTSLLDGYLYGYQMMANVFTGTLTPRNVPAGYGPFSDVSYRMVEPLDSELEQLGIGETDPEIVQTFEIWNITVTSGSVTAGSYRIKPTDEFTDADGIKWNVKVANSDSLRSSTRIPPTTRAVCVRQV